MRGQNEPEREDLVIGRGPVRELLKTGRQVECLFVQKGSGGSILPIIAEARALGIPVKESGEGKLDAMCAGSNHQGVIAQVSAARYFELDDLFPKDSREPVFLVAADGVEDPHNLGAIIRTAEAVGAHGLILPKRRSAGLSYTVAKTSAGASEHLPVARVTNLAEAISLLKRRGVWVYGADMGGDSWCGPDFSVPVALVLGAEGRGLSRLVRERCDGIISLPMRGKVASLNVSVAAGIILYEIARQRMRITARN